VSSGKVTITFDLNRLQSPEDFIDEAVVTVSNREDGQPCMSSGQLLNLLIRILGVLTVLSNGKVSDAYFDASHYSGLIVEAIQDALQKKFDVTIALESTPEQLN